MNVIGVPATVNARPRSLHNYVSHPIAFLVSLIVIASLITIIMATGKRLGLLALLASCIYLVAMLGGAAAELSLSYCRLRGTKAEA